jgi:hypothetical protein
MTFEPIKLVGKYSNYVIDSEGNYIVSFAFNGTKAQTVKQSVGVIKTALASGKEALQITIDLERKRRSLTANAYMWLLCEKLAEVLNATKVEIYQRFIKEQGIFKSLEISENAVDTFLKAWSMHGIGWLAERVDFSDTKGFVLVYAYYGSSVYSSKQMGRLVDAIVTECKEIGIETMPPHELEALVGRWKGEKI